MCLVLKNFGGYQNVASIGGIGKAQNRRRRSTEYVKLFLSMGIPDMDSTKTIANNNNVAIRRECRRRTRLVGGGAKLMQLDTSDRIPDDGCVSA